MTARKAAITTLKALLSALVLWFVYRQIADSWFEIREFDWQPDWTLAALSVLPALFSLFVFAHCWRLIIGGFGHRIDAGTAFRISYLSNLGRYVPGKVWQLFGMFYLARKEGVTAAEAGASFVIVQLFAIPSSILVYMLCALFEPSILSGRVAILGSGGTFALTAGIMALCGILVFKPRPVFRAANRLLSLLGRPSIEFRLDKSVALQVLVGYSLGWAVYGFAYWLFIRAVVGASAPGAVAATGLYNAAYQAGYLALFAPGGFGPRELVMGMLLTPFLGPLAAAVAVLARIWAIIIESLAAAVALGSNKSKKDTRTIGQTQTQ